MRNETTAKMNQGRFDLDEDGATVATGVIDGMASNKLDEEEYRAVRVTRYNMRDSVSGSKATLAFLS